MLIRGNGRHSLFHIHNLCFFTDPTAAASHRFPVTLVPYAGQLGLGNGQNRSMDRCGRGPANLPAGQLAFFR